MASIEKPLNKLIKLVHVDSFLRMFLSQYFILILSILIFLVMWPVNPNIASPRALMNILENLLPLFIIAIGQMYVLIIGDGGIDLSQPSIIGMTSVIGAIFLTNSVNELKLGSSVLWGTLLGPDGGPFANSPLATPVAILIMIIIGVLIGSINGFCIAKFKMPPFMVTLVTKELFLYIAIWLTQSFNITGLPDSFIEIGRGSIWTIPYVLIIAAVMGVIASIILKRTVLGKWLYATGINSRTARVSGVPTNRVIIFAYAFSGFCCAVGSIIYSGRLLQGSPTLCRAMLLDIIGATVIGGTSMFGGRGRVSGVLIGCLFFALMGTVLNLLRLSPFIINMVKGLFILTVALLDVIRLRRSES